MSLPKFQQDLSDSKTQWAAYEAAKAACYATDNPPPKEPAIARPEVILRAIEDEQRRLDAEDAERHRRMVTDLKGRQHELIQSFQRANSALVSHLVAYAVEALRQTPGVVVAIPGGFAIQSTSAVNEMLDRLARFCDLRHRDVEELGRHVRLMLKEKGPADHLLKWDALREDCQRSGVVKEVLRYPTLSAWEAERQCSLSCMASEICTIAAEASVDLPPFRGHPSKRGNAERMAT